MPMHLHLHLHLRLRLHLRLHLRLQLPTRDSLLPHKKVLLIFFDDIRTLEPFEK